MVQSTVLGIRETGRSVDWMLVTMAGGCWGMRLDMLCRVDRV